MSTADPVAAQVVDATDSREALMFIIAVIVLRKAPPPGTAAGDALKVIRRRSPEIYRTIEDLAELCLAFNAGRQALKLQGLSFDLASTRVAGSA